MANALPLSTPARSVEHDVAPEASTQTEASTVPEKTKRLLTAATLLSEMKDDFEQLSRDMQKVSSTLSDSVHEATQLTLTYTRLYDSAVEVLQEANEEAVDTAKQLAQRCISLGRELRGTDLLAERVHRLRRSVDQLEVQINKIF